MKNIITAEELRELEACEDGYVTFVEKNGSEATYLEALASNGIQDLLWYFDETDKLSVEQREDLQRLINGYALANIELIKPYTEDYGIIVSFLDGDESKREAAGEAAWVAARAAARAAVWAAEAAAWTAADAAAWTAAEAAAWAAWEAEAAARREQTKQLKTMLIKWEKADEK